MIVDETANLGRKTEEVWLDGGRYNWISDMRLSTLFVGAGNEEEEEEGEDWKDIGG